MTQDVCPHCGQRIKPMTMSVNPDAPGLIGLWRGEGDSFMQVIAKVGTLVIIFLIVLGLLVILH